MSKSVLHKAGDLPPEIRHRPHPAPTGAERAELARRLSERIDKTAAKLKDVPEAELDELIDEAIDHVRHHRT